MILLILHLPLWKKIQESFTENEQNMGIAKTRNKGIEASKGQYIAFLDSDDLWLPNKLEVQVKWMEEKTFLFTCSSYFVCNENGNITHERNFSEGPQTYQDLLKQILSAANSRSRI